MDPLQAVINDIQGYLNDANVKAFIPDVLRTQAQIVVNNGNSIIQRFNTGDLWARASALIDAELLVPEATGVAGTIVAAIAAGAA